MLYVTLMVEDPTKEQYESYIVKDAELTMNLAVKGMVIRLVLLTRTDYTYSKE